MFESEDRQIYRRVGAQVRRARSQRKLTQENLAQALGVSQQTISMIEQGRARLELARLLKLSRVLNQPVSYFIEPEPSNTTHSLRLSEDEISIFLKAIEHTLRQ